LIYRILKIIPQNSELKLWFFAYNGIFFLPNIIWSYPRFVLNMKMKISLDINAPFFFLFIEAVHFHTSILISKKNWIYYYLYLLEWERIIKMNFQLTNLLKHFIKKDKNNENLAKIIKWFVTLIIRKLNNWIYYIIVG
jgi:hypothetical protein